uniref:Uncharacterized protein n=1 Tax=Micrurus corallinus TaxID=54390 RepID=A0A2D4EVX8_MICCO
MLELQMPIEWGGEAEREGDRGHTPSSMGRLQGAGCPRLTTVHMVIVPRYNDPEKKRLNHFSQQPSQHLHDPCDQNSGAWQLSHIYDACSVPGSGDHLLRPPEKQSQGGSRISLTSIHSLSNCGKKNVK